MHRLNSLRLIQASVLVLIIAVALIGCAAIAEQSRMTRFEKMSQRYKELVLLSEFEAAYKFVDTENTIEDINLDALKNIKVTDYALKSHHISDDKLGINQSVEIEYHWLNIYKVRTILDKQIWKYDEERDTWVLQTGLPRFE
jgi:hypothetical protein